MFNLRVNDLGLPLTKGLKLDFDNEWQKPFLVYEIKKQTQRILMPEDYISRKFALFRTTAKYRNLEKEVGNIRFFLYEQITEENFVGMAIDRDAYANWDTNLYDEFKKNPEGFQVIYIFNFKYNDDRYYLKFKFQNGSVVIKSFHPDIPPEFRKATEF